MRILSTLLILFFSLTAFATTNANVIYIPPSLTPWLTDPNIVYVLILLAIYGILFELANPGMIFPGVTGVISLLLVLYVFQLLPINYLGVLLILCGIAFMMMEVYVTAFGMIGLAGVIAFITGSILLFNSPDPGYHVDWLLVIIMSAISFTFIFIVISLAIKSHQKKIVSGREGLIGSEGEVLNIMNEQISVRVLGEIWSAKSSTPLNSGDKIKVTHVKGLLLTVEPVKKKEY